MGDDFDPAAEPPTAPAVAQTGPLKRDLVAGLEKGLAVIEAFDQERPRLTNWRGDTVASINLTAHASRMSIDDLVATGLPALRQAQARLRQLL